MVQNIFQAGSYPTCNFHPPKQGEIPLESKDAIITGAVTLQK